MKATKVYTITALFTLVLLSLPIACTTDSEADAEALARRMCNCDKIDDIQKRESCIDKVMYEVDLHSNDPAFMTAFNNAAQACY